MYALSFWCAFSYTLTAQELRTSYFMKTATYRHQINPALLDHSYVGIPFLGNINVGATGNIGLKTLCINWMEIRNMT